MSNESSNEKVLSAESAESINRRRFLQSMGKWSGAAITAAIAGGLWFASSREAKAGGWINRRGAVGVGGWINRAGWVNRAGGWINGGGAGGWINRRVGGGGWVNRRGGGGGGWINRW
jgi:hypothetical protein